MGVLSELPLSAEAEHAVLFRQAEQPGTPQSPRYVEDEEFPPGLPVGYDWMFQPASRRRLRRMLFFMAIASAVFLVAAASYLAYKLPRLILPISASLIAALLFALVPKVLPSVRARSAKTSHTPFPPDSEWVARLPHV